VLSDGLRRDEVERTRPEPVRGRRQGTHRADLHGVARPVRGERTARLVLGSGADRRVAERRETENVLVEPADLLARAALLQVDELVPGDLLAEARAALAQDAALTVEEDLRRDLQRLRERPLDVREARRRTTVGQRLVLQGALAALVARGAVERVVDEQELHDAVL